MFANPQAEGTVEALSNRDGKQAHTMAEIEIMLSRQSFPLNKGVQYYKPPPPVQANRQIIEQSVKQASFLQPLRKVPGLDRLSDGAIRPLGK